MKLSGTCNGTYDITTASYITSPNYPQNYENNADCRWTIVAFNERNIALNITDFVTERNEDKLSIYNGTNDEGTRLEVFSGNVDPYPIKFAGRTAYLKFTSDQSDVKTGFRIELKAYGK